MAKSVLKVGYTYKDSHGVKWTIVNDSDTRYAGFPFVGYHGVCNRLYDENGVCLRSDWDETYSDLNLSTCSLVVVEEYVANKLYEFSKITISNLTCLNKQVTSENWVLLDMV